MSTKKRQKLCQTCEGEVDFDVIFCPFCGTDLLEAVPTQEEDRKDEGVKTLSEKESIASLYPSEESTLLSSGEEERDQEGISFLPLLLLSMASWLFVLSLLLVLFSDGGQLCLRFDAKMWLIYFLLSAPLGAVGWHLLQKESS